RLLREEVDVAELLRPLGLPQECGPHAREALAHLGHRIGDELPWLADVPRRVRPTEHLPEAALREPPEELGEPLDQVTLGDQQVDRELDAELAHQLLELVADRARALEALPLVTAEDLVRGDGDDEAVDRRDGPVLLEQLQELEP